MRNVCPQGSKDLQGANPDKVLGQVCKFKIIFSLTCQHLSYLSIFLEGGQQDWHEAHKVGQEDCHEVGQEDWHEAQKSHEDWKEDPGQGNGK